MLSDEQLDILSGALIPLYQHLEAWVIADVARRIKGTMAYTRTAELEVLALKKLGFSPKAIRAKVMQLLRADRAFQRQVEENTGEYKKAVAKKLKEVRAAAEAAGDDLIGGAADMTWADDVSTWDSVGEELKKDKSLEQITEAMKKQTRGELKNLTNTTGFRTDSGIEAVRDVFQKELDKALVKLSSGAATKEQCVDEVVRELARSGLRTIDYASGRSYQLDTAVRMCIDTAANQLAAKVSDENIRKTGVTLVQVSAHWGARDKGEGIKNHKEWQGKIYSIDGTAHSEEEKRIGMEIRDLAECTGYDVYESKGDVAGLHGVNCRHNHYPFFEGISTPTQYDPEPEPKEINGRTYSYYDMTQGMRRREREIRALKREQEAKRTLGEDTADVQAKIRQKTKEYQDFCNTCGIRQKPERLRVESGSSDLTKTQAWKEHKTAKNTAMDLHISLGSIHGVRIERKVGKTNVAAKDVVAIRDTISRLSKEYEFRLDTFEIGDYTDEVHIGSPMFARFDDDAGFLVRKFVINNACPVWTSPSFRKMVFESERFAGNSVADFAEHEIAHLITYQGCETFKECKRLEKKLRPLYTNGISKYSYSCKDGSETIAEAFVRKRKGKKINPDAQRLLDEYVEVWRKC